MPVPNIHELKLSIEVRSTVSLAGTGFKAGLSKTKGWFHRIFTASKVKQADGADADVTRSMKRKKFGNWYSEKVVDSSTGEVIHQCDEPLDVHQRHGSDKPRIQGKPSRLNRNSCAPIVHRPPATDRRRNVNLDAGFRRLGTQPPPMVCRA
jgi:hypothetical protein